MPNAQRATSWLPGARLAKSSTGGPDVAVLATVNASTPVNSGDFVTISSGKVTSIATGAYGNAGIYGVAAHSAAVNGTVLVNVATPENTFIARCKTGASSVAVPGLQCDIDGTAMTVAPTVTTHLHVQVVEPNPSDDTSDTTTPGRILFKIIRSQYTALTAANAT